CSISDMVSRPQAFTTRVWNQLFQRSVSPEMISYVAQEVLNVVERNPYNQNSTGPLDRVQYLITAGQHLDDKMPALEYFISSIVSQANIQVPILLTTLLYLSRLHSKLPPIAKDIRYIPHTIFLACLILSEKFLDDSSLSNRDWASCSQFEKFSLSNQEVNTIEKQVLLLLEWNLNFKTSELEHHLEPFLKRIRDSAARIRSNAYEGNRRKIRSSKANMKIAKSISERGVKQPFTTRKEVLIDSPSTVVAIKQLDSYVRTRNHLPRKTFWDLNLALFLDKY
ncbi:hypothetical protein O988_05291, partial [Pseudogymnoascus sp. VKM F-3808]